MKDNIKIHPLARENELSGKIKFIHSDGKEHIFYSCVNDMTGDRLSAFDGAAPTINQTIGEIKSIFNKIKSKTKVLECIGDF